MVRQSSKGAVTQEMLFWLAKCERSLSTLDWYSLNEIYLKECIVQYPKQSYSKACYDAYAEGMQTFYGPNRAQLR